jgi:hypothetical protein
VTSRSIMATIRVNCVSGILGKSLVIASRKVAMLIAAIGATSAVLHLSRAQAQWWSRAPADFEECADAAEKAATREERASAFTACNAKFAGRRKPGGGYTYFDFMQNRSFDIAGPNPTPAEQKHIDQQYTAYLDRERQSSIAGAFAAKQAQEQQVSLRSETEKVSRSEAEKASPPPQAPRKPRAAPTEIRPRIKTTNCTQHSFSCDWPRLSEGIKGLTKVLFGSPQGQAKAKGG